MSAQGRYTKGDARRDEILDAALTVFARSGYRGTSLREVADITGLTPPAILHHFGSREAMLAEVLRKKEEIASSMTNGASVLPRMANSLRANAAVPGLVQLHAVLSAQAVDPEHPAHEYIVDRYGKLRDRLEADLRAKIGADSDLDPARVAALLIAVADGMQVQWLLDDTVDAAAHFDYLLQLLGVSVDADEAAS